MAETSSPSPEARTRIETLLAQVVARLDRMDARLDAMDRRLDAMDARLNAIEKRSNVLIALLGAIIVALIATDGLLWNAFVTGERELRQEISQLSERIDERITGLDRRITDLELRLVERIHGLELAFVRSGINLQPLDPLPGGGEEQRSRREVAPGAGPDDQAE